jgi:uncharacterized protein
MRPVDQPAAESRLLRLAKEGWSNDLRFMQAVRPHLGTDTFQYTSGLSENGRGGLPMPYFAVFYDVVDDFVKRRAVFREEHLRLVTESYTSGELLLGGALADPVDRALLIFQVHDKSIVETFVQKDPYVVNGLVKKSEIRPWNIVTGEEAASHPAPPKHRSEMARSWSAHTSEEKWPLYREHFSQNVLPELRALSGYLGAMLCVRHVGDQREILVETYWRSLEAIHAFAGVDLETAVVADQAAAVLTDFDHRARHYEIVLFDRVLESSAPPK